MANSPYFGNNSMIENVYYITKNINTLKHDGVITVETNFVWTFGQCIYITFVFKGSFASGLDSKCQIIRVQHPAYCSC